MISSDTLDGNNPQKGIEIGAPSVYIDNDELLIVSYPITSPIFPDKLVFKIDPQYEEFIDQSLNCALVALMLPAMRSGLGIILNGPVSEKLFLSCQGNIQALVRLVLGYERVSLVSNHLRAHHTSTATVIKNTFTATGFSGGVDSYSILKEHHFSRSPSQKGVDCLIFNNVGANGRVDERGLFEKRLREARKGATAVGLPLIVVDSNMDEFYSIYPDLHFFKTHSFRNASVAHLLSNSVSRYLYAAARTYSEVRVEPSETIGNIDPITLPLLSSEHIDIQSEGAQYRRSEKLKALVASEIVQKNLYVCVDHNYPDGNCSVCQKCVRTLLVIDFLGYLNYFSKTFELKRYRDIKNSMLVSLLKSNDTFSSDIKCLMNRANVNLPLSLAVKIRIGRIFFSIKKKTKASINFFS